MIKNARIVCDAADPRQYFAQDAKRGEPGYVMSQSALINFAQCPARWQAGYNPPGSEAKDWGNLLDCRFLTSDKLLERYVIQPTHYLNADDQSKPWNNNASVCRAWVKEQKQSGKEIVTYGELEKADAAAEALMLDDRISAFRTASRCQVWLAAECHDPATGIIIPLRGLVDMAPSADSEFPLCLGDLKSTRNAAVLPWQRWCYSARYHWQAAFYLDLWNAATGEERNTFCFILQESYPPWQTAKRILSQDFIFLGRAEYRLALANYCSCLKRDIWPGYDDTDEAIQGWSLVQPEPWMAERAQFAPRFEFSESPEPAPESEYQDIIP